MSTLLHLFPTGRPALAGGLVEAWERFGEFDTYCEPLRGLIPMRDIAGARHVTSGGNDVLLKTRICE